MARYTLKEAADLTRRSVTTLRRYIRAGRLMAEKSPGRFGPEYTLDEESLSAAGFEISPPSPAGTAEGMQPTRDGSVRHLPVPTTGGREIAPVSGRPIEKVLADFVPADLYRELAMKHEQLLVQYGMVRASGQRMFEIRDEASRANEQLHRSEERLREFQDRFSREVGFLKRNLRQAELEIEERNVEVRTLRDKIRVLELLTRNQITNETIEKQFLQIFQKEREIDALTSKPGEPAGPAGAGDAGSGEEDHSSSDRTQRGLEALNRWLDSRLKAPPEDKPEH